MADNAFLDKGVILGYCFFTDTHHVVCKDYIESSSADFYATKQVEDIFNNKKESIIESHRQAILDYISRLRSEGYSGPLDESDIEEIQESIDREDNPAWRYLLDYFENNAGIDAYRVMKNLREIIRDVEQLAIQRNEDLQPRVNGWIRLSTYPDLEESLSTLLSKDEEDFWIAVDAHDLGVHLDGTTELATNNPRDFDDEVVKEEIFEHTSIDEIRLVFVSRSYRP